MGPGNPYLSEAVSYAGCREQRSGNTAGPGCLPPPPRPGRCPQRRRGTKSDTTFLPLTLAISSSPAPPHLPLEECFQVRSPAVAPASPGNSLEMPVLGPTPTHQVRNWDGKQRSGSTSPAACPEQAPVGEPRTEKKETKTKTWDFQKTHPPLLAVRS